MKRLFALLACVFLALGAFTACAQAEECVHSWDGGTVVRAATCGETGLMKYTCTLCGEQKEEVIPKLEHPASETYLHNDTEHWLVPSCEHSTERLQVAEHQWDGGTVVRAANCQTAGLKKYTCVCGYTKTEPIQKTGHTYAEEWSFDDIEHWHACTTEGCDSVTEKIPHTFNSTQTVNSVIYSCTCGYTYTVPAEHTEHTFAEEWSFDDIEHWHACTAEGCDVTTPKAAHSWDSGNVEREATCGQAGLKKYTCTDCGKQKEEVIPKTEHPASETYMHNDTEHWLVPSCEHIAERLQVVEHQWDDGVATTPATCQHGGVMTYTCVCGYTKTEPIPISGHSYKWIPKRGDKAVHTSVCEYCGEAEPETADQPHNFGDWERLPYSFSRVCTDCGYEYDAEWFEAVTGGGDGSSGNILNSKTVKTQKDNSVGLVYVVRTEGVYNITFTADEQAVTVKLHYFEIDLANNTSEEKNITQVVTPGNPYTVSCTLLDRAMVDIVIETDSETEVSCKLESAVHVHDFYGARWTHDATHHWHQCVAGDGCTERNDYAEHTYGADGACTECGFNPNS